MTASFGSNRRFPRAGESSGRYSLAGHRLRSARSDNVDQAGSQLWDYDQEPFRLAANTPVLHEAFNQLVGVGRWAPRSSLGTFPIRFPSDEDPGDAGWHTDAGFYADDGSMRLNVNSRGRALFMSFPLLPSWRGGRGRGRKTRLALEAAFPGRTLTGRRVVV